MHKDQDDLFRQARKQFRWYYFGSIFWSFLHHGSLALSIICSGASAFLQTSETLGAIYGDDYAAGLAAIASLLTAVAASGGFARKWRSNRLSRGRAHGVLIDLRAPDADLSAARKMLKEICMEHDEVVVGKDERDAAARGV